VLDKLLLELLGKISCCGTMPQKALSSELSAFLLFLRQRMKYSSSLIEKCLVSDSKESFDQYKRIEIQVIMNKSLILVEIFVSDQATRNRRR